ncbi:MAG: ketoacyl-ACP synthase III [Acidobacteria bacterium]|nr:ketoacyl-ACP synthase III [Acidobacteriota bacterium]
MGTICRNASWGNEELSERYGISVPEIIEKTGIETRRYVTDETTSDIVSLAISDLLSKSTISVKEIDCIIVGTLTPDHFFPSTAVSAINRLGAGKAWGFDLSAACSGFTYGLSVAAGMVQQGNAKNIIVCGADRMSRTLNNFDYRTALLFGDGAGAVLVQQASDDENIIYGHRNRVVADNLEDVFYKTPFNSTDWPSEKFELDGGKVYRNGIALTAANVRAYLNDSKLDLTDFEHIIPHQSNLNMIKDTAKELGAGIIEKFRVNITEIGNTGGASIPICLSHFVKNGTIRRGERVLLAGFGAGYTISIVDFRSDIYS